MFVAQVQDDRGKKRRKLGDRSGVHFWGFCGKRKMFFIKRKNRAGEVVEWYANRSAMYSLTKSDMSEVIRAPFYNTSRNTEAYRFHTFLDRHSRTNFEGLKFRNFFTRRYGQVRDPETDKHLIQVLWPATNKETEVPIPDPMPDNQLRNFECWVYNCNRAIVYINTLETSFQLIHHHDLLMFGENDIKTLAANQILVDQEIFESAAKIYTAFVAQIIQEQLWGEKRQERVMHILKRKLPPSENEAQ